MTLPADFDVVDCGGDERAPSAGVGTAAAVRARPAHSRRLRRVMGDGSKGFDFLDLAFMRLVFYVSELFAVPAKFHEEWLCSTDLLGNGFAQISRAGFSPNIRCAHF